MNQQPLVSVYITNYNYEKYIVEAIESVLGQSYGNIELIIIDDGSTDQSRTLIEQYRDQPDIQIIYQKNKGLNVTNNIAMRTAKGKYIVRLDADDIFHIDAIRLMVEKMESDENLGLVFPDYYYIDAQGNITGEEKRFNFESEVTLLDQPAHGACTMIRLDFLKQMGGYNEAFTCQDGYDLWIRFIKRHKVANINSPLFYYRRHTDNLTNNETRIIETRKRIKEYYVKENGQTIPRAVAIIPVRPTIINQCTWSLYEYNGKTVLEHKIDVALASDNIAHVIIVSSDQVILDHAHSCFSDNRRVSVVRRPDEYSRLNETLDATTSLAMTVLDQNGIKYNAIATLSLEYPFLQSSTIDDGLYTLSLFELDTVLSVRPNFHIHYRHNGHSLEPVLNQDKFTKLEREALYLSLIHI